MGRELLPGRSGGNISIERALSETVARCVGIVVYYYNVERTGRSRRVMSSEIRAAVGWLADSGLDGRALDGVVVDPVEEELIARFGHEVGFRLNREFVRAFDATVPVRAAHGRPPGGSPAALGEPRRRARDRRRLAQRHCSSCR